MRSSAFQRRICIALVVLVPVAFAQDAGVAVVNSTGPVFLNGARLSNSNAVVAGDVVQTRENGTAAINGPGASIAVEPNSILRFQGQSVALDRGQISVATGNGLSVNARDFKITPVSNIWTQFYVTRAGGTIGIVARKNDVTVNCGSASTTVKEGSELTRDDADNCGTGAKKAGAPAAAKAPILTSDTAKWTAVGAGAALTIWTLTRHDDPVSPDAP